MMVQHTLRRDFITALALQLVALGCGDERVARDAQADDVTTATDATAADSSGDDTTTATDATASDATSDAADIRPPDPLEPLGGERPAEVVLPLAYDPDKAWPLVLLLHGYSASGAIEDLYLGFSEDAAQAGFITIIPDGTTNITGEKFWNADPGWCCNFGGSEVDDQAYLLGLIDEAKTKWNVAPGRVYVFGHSNGGFMAHALACQHADRFAAIGSLAGSLPDAVGDCDPSEPVSVLQVHGTLDAVIVYPGNGNYPGAEDIVDRWSSYDECPGERVAGDPRDYDSSVPGLEATPSGWSGCAGGSEVALWTLAGSGHIPITLEGPFVLDVLTWFEAHAKAP